MTFPRLLRQEIEDQYVQENFKRIMDYGNANPLDRANFQFFSIEIPEIPVTIPPSTSVNIKYRHGLGFTPLDVIIMHNSNNAAITLNYSKFDSNELDINASGATLLRCLVGRYT
jgi:hypothetical protein